MAKNEIGARPKKSWIWNPFTILVFYHGNQQSMNKILLWMRMNIRDYPWNR